MSDMDVLYTVRPGEPNDELRWSLRSLKNIPHGCVAIAGYIPEWVSDRVIRLPREKSFFGAFHASRDTTANVLLGCEMSELTEDVLMMHDDMFILKPVESFGYKHLGPLSDKKRSYAGCNRLWLIQKGIRNPLNYEAHTPMVINREAMSDIIRTAEDKMNCQIHLKRSLYGNIMEVGGDEIQDVKLRSSTGDWRTKSVVSSSPMIFKDPKVGRWIKQQFPEPSPYER